MTLPAVAHQRQITAKIINIIKENEQDFEFYPTTQAMLDCIRANINERFDDPFSDNDPVVSVLDVGAGDGRALKALSPNGKKYAIEKSEPLLFELPEDIFVVGSDFHVNTLIDKKCDVCFSNPPYSEYEEWSCRIIKEANCAVVYLIIPRRWVDSPAINDALKARETQAETIGTFDFLDAERKARAVVDILMIELSTGNSRYNKSRDPKTDPFTIWFDECFSLNAQKTKNTDYQTEQAAKATLADKVSQQLVAGKNLIQALVELYNTEMQHLISNYQAVGRLDSSLLKELGVSVKGLREGLQLKIAGLKSRYWQEFFHNYEKITSRLTSKSREAMLDKLHANMSIDFTESNALALTAWAIKNCNVYYDNQLVEMVERMISEANITLYKSNLRTWGEEDWRYCRTTGPADLCHYGLELRIVLHRYCAIEGGGYGYSFDYENGLHKDAHTFIGDLLTVIGNLGFENYCDSRLRSWTSGKKQMFSSDEGDVVEIKAYKNGNIHLRFNQLVIRRLNVEFGRIKGWLKNKAQAAEELNIPLKEVENSFNSNHQLTGSMVPQICHYTEV